MNCRPNVMASTSRYRAERCALCQKADNEQPLINCSKFETIENLLNPDEIDKVCDITYHILVYLWDGLFIVGTMAKLK